MSDTPRPVVSQHRSHTPVRSSSRLPGSVCHLSSAVAFVRATHSCEAKRSVVTACWRSCPRPDAARERGGRLVWLACERSNYAARNGTRSAALMLWSPPPLRAPAAAGAIRAGRACPALLQRREVWMSSGQVRDELAPLINEPIPLAVGLQLQLLSPISVILLATTSILDLAKVLRLTRNLYLTLRKCCACHDIYTCPCEKTAPAMKSVIELAKLLRLARSPNPFRDRSETASAHAVCALSGTPIHAQRQRFCILLSPSSSAAPATKPVLDLAKVLRLPRIYTSPCECAAPATQFNPCETCARPCQWSHLQTRSGTVPGPFRDRLRTGRDRAHCPELQFTHSANVFCIWPSPGSPDFSIYRSFSRTHPCILKLSVCQASYMCQSYLSVKAIFWKAIYASSYLSWPYVGKQLAHLVPVLRKFLVELPLVTFQV